MNKKELIGFISRYLIALLLGLFGINLIYLIFNPLTSYPALWILKPFYPLLRLEDNSLILNIKSVAAIIPACIAGAAYYLLIALNLATPMNIKTRTKSLSFLILSFLFLNIIRFAIFTGLFFEGYKYFDMAHEAVWYFGSTILVVILWFANVALFKIKGIPACTDLKNLLKDINHKRKTRR